MAGIGGARNSIVKIWILMIDMRYRVAKKPHCRTLPRQCCNLKRHQPECSNLAYRNLRLRNKARYINSI